MKTLKRSLATSLAVGLLLLILSGMAIAWNPPDMVTPESVGMDGKVLNDGISSVVNTYIQKKAIPGAVVLVSRHGKVAYFEAFGDMKKGKPMTKDAIFGVASMSKTVTAVAVMQLVDQGKILLTDPVSMYIPAFAKPKVAVEQKDGSIKLVPAKREITVHDLLSMTSGIAFTYIGTANPLNKYLSEVYIASGIKDGMDDYEGKLEDHVKVVAKLPLAFHPGEGYLYSNPGVNALGYLVEVVSGQPLDEYLKENIFSPLAMVDSGFYPPESEYDRVPHIWWAGGPGTPDGRLGTWQAVTEEGALSPNSLFSLRMTFSKNRSFFIPSGGIHSTTYDWFRFAQMFLNKGTLDGHRILSRQAVTLMTTNQIGDLVNTFWDNRWGYMIDIQEDDVIDMPYDHQYGGKGAYGWMGIWGTRWYVNPKEDTTIVFMSHNWFLWNILPATERLVHIVNRSIY